MKSGQFELARRSFKVAEAENGSLEIEMLHGDRFQRAATVSSWDSKTPAISMESPSIQWTSDFADRVVQQAIETIRGSKR